MKHGINKSLKKFLRGKYDDNPSRVNFRLRYRQDCEFDAIESGRPVESRSPGSWIVSASILRGALQYLVRGDDSEVARKRTGATADRAARCMLKALDNCQRACGEYKRKGWELPPDLTRQVRRCAETYGEYEQWRKEKLAK